MKNKKKTNKNSKRKLIFYLILGGLLLKLFGFFKKEKTKDKIHNSFENFKDFLEKEKKEANELKERKECFNEFCSDSSSIFMDYFIPYHGNGHKPKILRSRSLLAIAVVLVFLKIFLITYLFLTYPPKALMSEALSRQVVELVNQDRIAMNLPAIKVNPVLSASALAKANDMLEKNYFAHYGPDNKKPWEWIDRLQYKYLYVGENLAMNFTSADSVHRALMESPAHKKNILNEKYSDIGLGLASGVLNGKKTDVLVQFFASRQATAPVLADKGVESKIAGTTKENYTKEKSSLDKIAVLSKTKDSASKVKNTEDKIEADGQRLGELIKQAYKQEQLKKNELEHFKKTESQEDNFKEAKIVEFMSEKENQFKKDKKQASSTIMAESCFQPKAALPKITQKIAWNSGFPMGENKIRGLALGAYNISQNINLENMRMADVRGFKNTTDKRIIFSANMVKLINFIFVAVLTAVVLLLLINIIVRFEIQHKPVILQTMFLIIFISGLVYFKPHFLESGLPYILIL